MSSNVLAGERRWATSRRGGMTVLRKVAVPKPLNLPSQRLENRGLDPNVEIVPKGTIGWGSCPSSSGSNAWVSSTPNADGGTTSPGHLSGCPSSGGSGTRPSTAGSDRTCEPVTNAWSSNSRPSSDSGSLSSNQTSFASLRPRSAETKPNISHLSRFAEPVSESSVAWGSSSNVERLGVKSSKEDGFSLSFGDFPTLGSERENSVRNSESQGHGHPSSGSGRIAHAKEDKILYSDTHSGTLDTMRTDDFQSEKDGIYQRIEKWQGEPQQFCNAKVPLQHYDAWHNPHINASAGVWYRGHPGGPAYGAPVAPSNFPMEPFPYYRPQIRTPALGGSQSVRHPQCGPRGPHLRDLYRPQMPDAYARQGMPFQPRFCPGPPGPIDFEGYYGSPMGYHNYELEIPFMGMAASPHVYNGYPGPSACDLAISHGRATGHDSGGKTLSEQVDDDHRGKQGVPLKNREDWDQKEEGEYWECSIQSNDALCHGKSSLPIITSKKNEWETEGYEDADADADICAKWTPCNNSAQNFEYQRHSSDNFRVKHFEGMGNAVSNNWTNKLQTGASFPPEMPQLPLGNETNPSLGAATKDLDLMRKIEGLNAKFRASDGQYDAPNIFGMEQQKSRSQVIGMKINNYTVEVSNTAGSFETTALSRDFSSMPHQVIISAGTKMIQPTAIVSRRSNHGGQVKVNQHGRGKFKSHDADGWQKKPLTSESSDLIKASTIESASNIHVHGPNFVDQTVENPVINATGNIGGECFAETCDSSDIHAQRAKTRELAKHCTLQLRQEEEEQIWEQKAKAFTKLEELNRRTQANEVTNQKAETNQPFGEIQGDLEESCTLGESMLVDPKVLNTCITVLEGDSSNSQSGESLPVLESDVSHVQSLHVKEDAHLVNTRKSASQLNGGISRHNRTGYKQKLNNSFQKTLNEKSVSNFAYETPEDPVNKQVASSEIQPSGNSNVPNASSTVAEPSAKQTKHKLDGAPVLSSVLSDSVSGKESVQNVESKASLSSFDSSLSLVTEPDRRVQASEACSSSPNEDAHRRVRNQRKHQLSRQTPRSLPSNRLMDKIHSSDTVIWAPVRIHNKVESAIEVNQKPTLESANATNNDNLAENNSSKGKRAEMERYVVKPVAKELAQQGSIPSLSSPNNSYQSEEVPGSGESGWVSSTSLKPLDSATFVGSSVEMEEDGRHNKHEKEHGTWRLRGSTDSSHMKGVRHGPSPLCEPTKGVQTFLEQHQFMKSEITSVNAETNASCSVDAPDGSNISRNTTTGAVGKFPVVKDQGATVRGKRYLPRLPRSMGNNPNHGNILSGETEGSTSQAATPYVDQTDRTVSSKDDNNQSLGDRTPSHWQPKSHINSVNNQHGNRTVTKENRVLKNQTPPHKVQVPPQYGNQSHNVYQPLPDQSVSESDVAGESIVGQHLDVNTDKKPAAKERPYSPNQNPVNSNVSVFTSPDVGHEHNVSSGPRRGGKRSSRYFKSLESHGDWSSGQDNRPTNRPAFWEGHGQKVHYEYQPVEPNKNIKPGKLDGPVDGANNVGQRYRKKGQSHSKRVGNSYG